MKPSCSNSALKESHTKPNLPNSVMRLVCPTIRRRCSWSSRGSPVQHDSTDRTRTLLPTDNNRPLASIGRKGNEERVPGMRLNVLNSAPAVVNPLE